MAERSRGRWRGVLAAMAVLACALVAWRTAGLPSPSAADAGDPEAMTDR